MKPFFATAVLAIALSLNAAGAQAHSETDRAMGAGSYVHPNGPAEGIWTTTPQGAALMGFDVAQRKV